MKLPPEYKEDFYISYFINKNLEMDKHPACIIFLKTTGRGKKE